MINANFIELVVLAILFFGSVIVLSVYLSKKWRGIKISNPYVFLAVGIFFSVGFVYQLINRGFNDFHTWWMLALAVESYRDFQKLFSKKTSK